MDSIFNEGATTAVKVIIDSVIVLAMLLGLACVVAGIVFVAKRLTGKTTLSLRYMGEIETGSHGLVLVVLGIFLFLAGSKSWSPSTAEGNASSLTQMKTLMANLTKRLRDEFHLVTDSGSWPFKAEGFERTNELIRTLKLIDPTNGAAIYYDGEVKRAEGRCELARDAFLAYIDVADHVPESETGKDTSREFCYEQPHGYCRQRNGYVQYLLAHRFYWEGLHEEFPSVKKDRSREALRHLVDSTKWYPDGFDNIIPHRVLEMVLTEEVTAIEAGRPVAGEVKMDRPC